MKRRLKFDILLGAVIIGLITTLVWSQLSTRNTENPYDRSEFGSSWFDTDGNSCDTRNDVLAQQLQNVTKEGCKVIGGIVYDPYTGKTTSFVPGMAFPIDHVVSLRDAWDSGAWKWTDHQRLLFANDLHNLQVTSKLMNEQKSDSGPDQWLPPHDQCGFVTRYSEVKEAYNLSLTSQQQQAVDHVLAKC